MLSCETKIRAKNSNISRLWLVEIGDRVGSVDGSIGLGLSLISQPTSEDIKQHYLPWGRESEGLTALTHRPGRPRSYQKNHFLKSEKYSFSCAVNTKMDFYLWFGSRILLLCFLLMIVIFAAVLLHQRQSISAWILCLWVWRQLLRSLFPPKCSEQVYQRKTKACEKTVLSLQFQNKCSWYSFFWCCA